MPATATSMTEQELPRAVIDAERAVLGSMLISTGAVGKIMDMLTPEDFHQESHRHIYDAACAVAMRNGGKGVDMTTVYAELLTRKLAGDAGGHLYIAQCQDSVATPAHAEHYARLVLEASLDRKIGRQLLITASNKTPENVAKLAELMAAMSSVHHAALFDFRRDLPGAVERLLAIGPAALKTGIPGMDAKLGALRPGDVITIGARTGVGKTALMARLAVSMAQLRAPVLYATTEMDEDDMLGRILPMALRMDAWRFRARQFETSQAASLRAEANGWLAQLPLTIYGRPRLSLSDLRAATNRAQAKVVFVDYLQRCQFRHSETHAQAVTQFMADLKTFAQERGVVVFLGCQLSRLMDKTATTPPSLGDLKDSGGIEAESDIVGLLWRPSKDALAKRSQQPEAANIGLDLIIAKHRHGASGVVVELELEARYVRMLDIQEIGGDHEQFEIYEP